MKPNYFSRKFLLTAVSLAATFLLFAFGKDVRQLEIIVPAILAFYSAHNVAQDWVMNNRNKQQ